MTNNTIPNVPRELLDSLLTVIESNGYAADEVEVVDELRAILSAPSPAGVDGLEAVKVWEADADWDDHELVVRLSDATAIIDGLRGEVGAQRVKTCTALKERNDAREERDAAATECERLRMQLAACGVVALANTIESAGEARQMHPDYMSASCSDVAGAVDREIALRTERDHQAQRIGELEGLLREVRNGLSCENLHHKKSEQHAFDEPCKVLVRIDAALSAGKEGE